MEESMTREEARAQLEELRRRRDEIKEQIRSWAIDQGGHLARLVQEGYDCTSAVLDRIVVSVLPPDGTRHSIWIRERDASWGRYSWSTRDSPTERALRERDLVVDRIVYIPHPECVEIEVLPVQRVTIEPDERAGEDEDVVRHMTCVVVEIRCPISSGRAVVFPVE